MLYFIMFSFFLKKKILFFSKNLKKKKKNYNNKIESRNFKGGILKINRNNLTLRWDIIIRFGPDKEIIRKEY